MSYILDIFLVLDPFITCKRKMLFIGEVYLTFNSLLPWFWQYSYDTGMIIQYNTFALGNEKKNHSLTTELCFRIKLWNYILCNTPFSILRNILDKRIRNAKRSRNRERKSRGILTTWNGKILQRIGSLCPFQVTRNWGRQGNNSFLCDSEKHFLTPG